MTREEVHSADALYSPLAVRADGGYSPVARRPCRALLLARGDRPTTLAGQPIVAGGVRKAKHSGVPFWSFLGPAFGVIECSLPRPTRPRWRAAGTEEVGQG